MDANGDLVADELLSPGSSFASHSRLGGPSMPSPSPPDPDPYEFSDEASKDPKTLTRPSREREDGMSRPSPLSKMVTAEISIFNVLKNLLWQ